MNSGWSLGLKKTINDVKNLIISSDIAVVINDKYPKAKYHYLVLPREDIATIFDLNKTHLPLLEELYLMALNIIEVKQLQCDDFKIGFHALPSMQHLHLHVISKDFVSDCLKTKKHWNSFNTTLFLPYSDLCKQLEVNNCVKRLEKVEIQNLTDLPMQCNQCDFIAKNIPKLKEHLLEHWKIRNDTTL